MNKIFIEIPNTTHEMMICVPAEEDVWSFRMIFFESGMLRFVYGRNSDKLYK